MLNFFLGFGLIYFFISYSFFSQHVVFAAIMRHFKEEFVVEFGLQMFPAPGGPQAGFAFEHLIQLALYNLNERKMNQLNCFKAACAKYLDLNEITFQVRKLAFLNNIDELQSLKEVRFIFPQTC